MKVNCPYDPYKVRLQQLVAMRKDIKRKFPNFNYYKVFTERRVGDHIRSKFWIVTYNNNNWICVRANQIRKQVVNYINKHYNDSFTAVLYHHRNIVIKSKK